MVFLSPFVLCTVKHELTKMVSFLIVKFKHPLMKIEGDILFHPIFNNAIYFSQTVTSLLFTVS